MSTIAAHSSVLNKTRELCEEIASDPEVRRLLADVERFLADDSARLQYQSVHERGEELHQKQHAGMQLGRAEVTEFEAARDSLMSNPVARGFLDAQETLSSIQKEIGKYVSLTFELGRAPTAEDIEEANSGECCGGGCGCSH